MALSQAEKDRWAEIDAVIAENKAELKAAESHDVLREFAKTQGWDNAADFGKYKSSLRKIGVSYDDLRAETFAKRDQEAAATLEELDSSAPQVELWSAAVVDGKRGAFALVDEEDEAVWYGNFFQDDRIFNGDLISGEQSAADKAVWVAHKAFEARNIETGRLFLHTTCPDLDIAALKAAGVRLHVAVEIEVDQDERAVRMAEAPGFKRYQDHDLAALVATEED